MFGNEEVFVYKQVSTSRKIVTTVMGFLSLAAALLMGQVTYELRAGKNLSFDPAALPFSEGIALMYAGMALIFFFIERKHAAIGFAMGLGCMFWGVFEMSKIVWQ